MSIYVLRSVYGSKTEFTLFTLFTELYIGTGMKMSCYTWSTPKNKLYYRIPTIFFPTSNHILPGHRRDRHRPPAVGWSCLPIRGWFSRLTVLPRKLSTNTTHQPDAASNHSNPALLSGRLVAELCPRFCSQLVWCQGCLAATNLEVHWDDHDLLDYCTFGVEAANDAQQWLD